MIERSLNILILGGTHFLGRTTAEALLARGHHVTLFHRGQTLPEGLSGAENVIADRAQGFEPLGARCWDAAIDMWGTVPSVASAAATTFASRVERYWYFEPERLSGRCSAADSRVEGVPAGDDAIVSAADCSRAVARGLRFRPLEETVRGTLEWDRTRPSDAPLQAELDADKERRLLGAWSAEVGGYR